MLLKKFSEKGFVFYTNYDSRKGKSIANNPNVCISFFWPSHERQVIIKGSCKLLSDKESDKYFYSRPKDIALTSTLKVGVLGSGLMGHGIAYVSER